MFSKNYDQKAYNLFWIKYIQSISYCQRVCYEYVAEKRGGGNITTKQVAGQQECLNWVLNVKRYVCTQCHR